MFGLGKVHQKLDAIDHILSRNLAPLLAQISPMEALKIIFTPENIEAATRGLGEGLAKGLKDNG